MTCYVGCMIETSLGTAAYLQVALAAAPVVWGCELFGPLLLTGDVVAGARRVRGRRHPRARRPRPRRRGRRGGHPRMGAARLMRHDARPGARVTDVAPAIETRGLTKRFGGLVAVDDLSLAVPPGQIRGLIGPNGSGKTTTVNVLSGLYRPDAGEIHLCGRRTDRLRPHEIAACGVARTFQISKLFGNMTVLENVLVPALAARDRGAPALVGGRARAGARPPRLRDARPDAPRPRPRSCRVARACSSRSPARSWSTRSA